MGPSRQGLQQFAGFRRQHGQTRFADNGRQGSVVIEAKQHPRRFGESAQRREVIEKPADQCFTPIAASCFEKLNDPVERESPERVAASSVKKLAAHQ